MRIRLILLVLTLPAFAFTQSYQLIGKISGLSDQYVYLHSFYGAEKGKIDSVKVAKDGSFTYRFPQNAYRGMYRLRWSNNKMMDIIFHNENIRFTTHTNSVVDSLRFLESRENQMYFEYLKKRNEAEFKLELLQPLINHYPRNDPFYQTLLTQFQLINDHLTEYVRHQTENYPGSLAARIIRFDFTPRSSTPLSDEEHLDFLKNHFFDNTDFGDTMLLYSNVISSKVVQFLSLYRNTVLEKEEQEAEFIKAVDVLIQKSRNAGPVFTYILDFLVSGFGTYGFDKVIAFIAERFDPENKCFENQNKTPIEQKLETLKKFAVGKKIDDFEAMDLTGRPIKLSALSSDYVLLIFWASWCPHCNTLVTDLRKAYLPDNRHKLEVVAVSLDESPDELKKFIETHQLHWINICDGQKWNGDLVRKYGVYATPTIFLLDRNLQILARPADYKETMDALFRFNVLK